MTEARGLWLKLGFGICERATLSISVEVGLLESSWLQSKTWVELAKAKIWNETCLLRLKLHLLELLLLQSLLHLLYRELIKALSVWSLASASSNSSQLRLQGLDSELILRSIGSGCRPLWRWQ